MFWGPAQGEGFKFDNNPYQPTPHRKLRVSRSQSTRWSRWACLVDEQRAGLSWRR